MQVSVVRSCVRLHRQVLLALVQFAEQLREGFKRIRDLYVEVMTALDRTLGWLEVSVYALNDDVISPYIYAP